MAKKKTYYRKKAVLKAISKYHRRKLNFVFDVLTDAENVTYIDGQQASSFIVGEALNSNSGEFQQIGKQYAFVKLRGILLEVNPYNMGSRYNVGLSLGHANDSLVFNVIRTQPNIMLIDSHQKSRMYYKISSEFTSTNDIQLFNNISIIPFTQGSGAMRYSVKITLYLTFKTNL